MKTATMLSPWQREYFSAGYKISFLNAVHLRLQAGESVGQAIISVIGAERNPAKQRDMGPALQALEQGESVSTALDRLGFFDRTALAILRAGERSGMRDAVQSAATHLSIRQAWIRQHALVLFILANELLSAALTPVLVLQEVLPWIRAHVSPPANAGALQVFQHDMALAENLTRALIALTLLLLLIGGFNLYRVSRLRAHSRLLIFFSDGAMAVGFKLAAAMLRAGVTIEQAAQELRTQSPGWSSRYWSAVHAQLQQAYEPAQALLQNGLYANERSLLASHGNARQLADIFSVISEDRQQKAKRGRDVLLLGGTLLTVAYILMSLGIAIWIYITYNSMLAAGLDALGNGF
jgi:type II secretory pathway component PulF